MSLLPALRRSAPSRSSAARTMVALGATLGATALALPAAARAQAVLGIGDDALVLPKGVVRVRTLGQSVRFDERFGGLSTSGLTPDRREALLTDLNIASIGTVQFPSLLGVEAGLRQLTQNPGYNLSLGRTTATGGARINAGTIVFEIGATRRLSFGVVVPLVETRNTVNLGVNANGEGNVGFNPAAVGIEGFSSAAARTQLQQSVTAYQQAAAGLQARLPQLGCTAAPTAPQCVQLATLIGTTNAVVGGINQIYAGSPFVPITGTPEYQRLVGTLAQLQGAYANAGIALPTFALPGAARIDLAGAQQVLTNPLFGVSAEQVGTTVRRGLGDVEVAAKYLLFDSFGGDRDPNARLTPSGVNVRAAITGLVRIGTGRAENPVNFVDVPTGTGAHGLGFRANTDLLLGRHFFSSFALRYLNQIADDQWVRVVDAPERVLAPVWRTQKARRDLGDIVELEATPRWVLNDWLLVAGQYTYRNKTTDRWTGTWQVPQATTGYANVSLDARTLEIETAQREHRVGGGLSLSSVKAFARGKAKVPAELTYLWQQTVDGAGGATPRLTLHQVQLRLYARLWGG